MTVQILLWLDGQNVPPDGIEHDQWSYSVRYAKERYKLDLNIPRYTFRRLGWRARRRGHDVGSGAGDWAIAFALDNEQAYGIDQQHAFVTIANGAAAAIGFRERVAFQRGIAEALPYHNDSFDVVWSNGVLMFCDIEQTVAETARVLARGGEFYCGWSGIRVRISTIYEELRAQRKPALEQALRVYISMAMQRAGLSNTPWSRMRWVTPEELAAACAVFGMVARFRPGMQRPGAFIGIPYNLDLLCVKTNDSRERKAALLDLSPAAENGQYRELIELGLGRLVFDVLSERGDSLNDPDIRSLYVLAAVRAGRAKEISSLVEDKVEPIAKGLWAFELRQMTKAIDAFRSMRPGDPARAFILGTALLVAGETDWAAREFEIGIGEMQRPFDCAMGAMLARIDAACWLDQFARLDRALPHLADFGGGRFKIRFASDLLRRSAPARTTAT